MPSTNSPRPVAALREVPASPPLFQTRGLCFETGGKRLIHGIDLEISGGRSTVIMGPNGAGKSLLMRLLHGLLKPTSGEILWNGSPLDRDSRHDQAMVFQRPVLLRRSVLANLRFALNVKGIRGPERRRRERDAIDQARLHDLAHRPARVLSGGEQQRLAIARALACSPKVLLLDEPCAALDPASTLEVERLVGEARKAGVAVILITHDAGQARRIGDDLIFLHGGRVAESGPVATILDTPKSEPVRAWRDGRLYVDPIHIEKPKY